MKGEILMGGSTKLTPVLEVVEGGLSGVVKKLKEVKPYKFDSRGELSLPFGMTAMNSRKGVIEFYPDSIKYKRVSVSSGQRFIDAIELFDKVARESCNGAAIGTADVPMPLMLIEYLEKKQSEIIPKRLQGKIILLLESFLTDSVGKLHVRTLEYNTTEKQWVRSSMPIHGAAFYPEFFVVARCKLHFGGRVAISNYYDDTT